MGKRQRLKRLKAAAAIEGPKQEARGPISEQDARRRARVYRAAGVTTGTIAWGSRARRMLKRSRVKR